MDDLDAVRELLTRWLKAVEKPQELPPNQWLVTTDTKAILNHLTETRRSLDLLTSDLQSDGDL